MAKLLTVREIAELLAISTRTVYRLINRGEILATAFGDGRLMRADRRDVESFVERRKRAAKVATKRGRGGKS